MNKTKKGLLTASSILTIVSASFAIIISILLMFVGSVFTKDLMKDVYRDDPAYTYYEEADGSYYFTYLDEENIEVTITQEEIATIASVASSMLKFFGVGYLLFSVARMILAIRILVVNSKNKYSKGCVIALLVLSIINISTLETIFLIVAMCLKDNQSIDKAQQNNISPNNNDIELKEIN